MTPFSPLGNTIGMTPSSLTPSVKTSSGYFVESSERRLFRALFVGLGLMVHLPSEASSDASLGFLVRLRGVLTGVSPTGEVDRFIVFVHDIFSVGIIARVTHLQ